MGAVGKDQSLLGRFLLWDAISLVLVCFSDVVVGVIMVASGSCCA